MTNQELSRLKETELCILQVLIYYGVVGLAFMIGFIVCRLISSTKLMKASRFLGALNVALTVTCALLMLTNTAIVFNSPIDSFFLTAFTIVIPKYIENAVILKKEIL